MLLKAERAARHHAAGRGASRLDPSRGDSLKHSRASESHRIRCRMKRDDPETSGKLLLWNGGNRGDRFTRRDGLLPLQLLPFFFRGAGPISSPVGGGGGSRGEGG